MLPQVCQSGIDLGSKTPVLPVTLSHISPLARRGVQPPGLAPGHERHGRGDHLVRHHVGVQPQGRQHRPLADELGGDGNRDLEGAGRGVAVEPVHLDAVAALMARHRHGLLPRRGRQVAVLAHQLRGQREIVLGALLGPMGGPRETVRVPLLELLRFVREDPEGAPIRGHDVDLNFASAHHLAVRPVQRDHDGDGGDRILNTGRHHIEVPPGHRFVPSDRRQHPAADHDAAHDQLQIAKRKVF
mmetsp:Transcript_23643/g.71024  ORF Transcript_23643/g.71024 Transcript_23643/m.71024 type:complete len:243 (-) Transcript_23643:1994-2722(-)